MEILRDDFFLQYILCFMVPKIRVSTSPVSSSKSFNIRCLSWDSLWLCLSSVTSNHQLLSSGFQHIWHGPWFPRWCSRHYKISNKQKTSCNSMWMRKLAPLTKTCEYFREQKVQVAMIFFLETPKHNSFNKMTVQKKTFFSLYNGIGKYKLNFCRVA